MLQHPNAGPQDRCVLTPTQRQVVDLLANGATVAAAAEAASLHRNTIFTWRQSPHFRAALTAAVNEKALLRHQQLEALVPAAFDTLRAALTGPAASPALRVRTALAILDRAAVAPAPALVTAAQSHVIMSSPTGAAPNPDFAGGLKLADTALSPDPPNSAQPATEILRTNPIPAPAPSVAHRPNIHVIPPSPADPPPNPPNSAQPAAKISGTKPISTAPAGRSAASPALSPISVPKIGRNDPCPCGSGHKYKKCCLR